MSQRIFALLLCFVACVICERPLQAQTSGGKNPDYDKQFYLFASPGALERRGEQVSALAIGAGVERFVSQRIALGAEVADSITRDRFNNSLTGESGRGASRVFWLALNGAYNFQRKDSPNQWRPFLTAGCGISGVNNAGAGEQLNYGAGFNRWHTRHVGLRIEVRRFLHYGDAEERYKACAWGWRFANRNKERKC